MKGFTLIELLVVVLIIGILASIALPQYQTAVAKSKYVQAMTVGDKIWLAQQEHFLASNEWAETFDDLVIEPPAGHTGMNAEHTQIRYPWGVCWMSPNPNAGGLREMNCSVLDGALYFVRGYEGQDRRCRAYYNKPQGALAEKVCKSMGPVQYEGTELEYRQYTIR